MHTGRVSFKRTHDDDDERDLEERESQSAPPRRRRIRCPKCNWEPGKRDRWGCSCGHGWNTFDTAGLCPACGKQWADTQCLRCHQWSKHVDWYEDEDPDFD